MTFYRSPAATCGDIVLARIGHTVVAQPEASDLALALEPVAQGATLWAI
jgi:hypothetical protein